MLKNKNTFIPRITMKGSNATEIRDYFQQKFSGKKVLILGFGKEGRESFAFIVRLSSPLKVGIADQKELNEFPKSVQKFFQESGVILHLGENYHSAIALYDIVVKSPGIPFRNLPKKKKYTMTTQTEIFLDLYPGTIIGITGTKGKSTTTFLVWKLLKRAGYRVFIGGNIGDPVLHFLSSGRPKDILVYELSSHQLYSLKRSPHIAVLLNIFPEHLDYYGSLGEYRRAKVNIAKFQTKKDFFIYNADDPYIRTVTKQLRGFKLPFYPSSASGISVPYFIHPATMQVLLAIARVYKIKRNIVQDIVKTWRGLEHRLEKIGTHRGIIFVNDSISTIPQSTAFALHALGDNVSTLIAGGFDRGVNFDGLAKKIVKSKVQNLLLFRPSGKRILEAIKKFLISNKRIFFANNMRETVKLAYKYTPRGKICLLSPASPSFGLFRDYQERGEMFKKYVRFYGRKRRK